MPAYTDQLGRTLELQNTPHRIISLVPSITELLYSLQLDEKVVGITKFCVHPETWFRTKTRIGGTKAVKADVIHQLQPDLILANKEENIKEQIEALAKQYPVWVSDVNDLNDALDMILDIGMITNRLEKAADLIHQINTSFINLSAKNLEQINQSILPPRTCYLIWREPYMTIGGDTFINDMLMRAGFENIFEYTARYPTVTIEDIQANDCQVLMLSSEPFPFKQKHIDELQPHLPNTKIIVVDGELFSWYGSRLLHAPSYFTGLLRQLNQNG
jgi:ABC-type Fe3+-hydroxamate transport system substrate-binding protein